jgi:hypothetical protein
MSDATNWNAIAAREGERRREARPHRIGDVIVQYRRLYDADDDKAAVIIKIPDRPDLIIGPLRSATAKEMFDSICQPTESVAQSEIKVGDRVRVRGDYEDFTEDLDGKVGTVIEGYDEEHGDYLVMFDDIDDGRRIWSHNIVEVLKR